MTTGLMFIPIILLIGILFVSYLIIRYGNFRNVRYVLGMYGFILLGSVIVFYVLPARSSEVSFVAKEEITQLREVDHNFYQTVLSKKVGETDHVMVKQEWEFAFSAPSLDIIDRDYFMWIVVEQKDVADGKIEATHYMTRYVVEGIDVTDKISDITLNLVGEALHVGAPERYEIEMVNFKKEFVISQFTGEKSIFDYGYRGTDIVGRDVLYLRVPSNVKVKETANVEFIAEDGNF